MAKTAFLIGSGVAGLASACLLAQKGYAVTVFEASETYGGKLGQLEQNGFRFDTGPSLFTLPEVLDGIFLECGENPRNYYSYKQLPVICKYFFADGQTINAYSELNQFIATLVDNLGESEKKVRAYFENIKVVYDYVSPIFLENPLREFKKHLTGSAWNAVQMLRRMEAHKSLHQSNTKWFKNEKTIQLFNRFATYNGSNPYKAPATLNVIPHLEHDLGAYYVNGGMRKVAEALYQLALKKGVQFKFETAIEQIVMEDAKAVGVKNANFQAFADQIVCNMDVNQAYTKLLPKIKAPSIYLNREKSTSALVFYWSMKAPTPALDVHNILFSANYKAEFEHLAKGAVTSDPTIYIYISSKVDCKDAPEEKENWFTMINVPHDQGQNWEVIVSKAKEAIIRKIEGQLKIDVRSMIEAEEILTPKDIAIKTSSSGGALYGNSSNNMFAAFLRHPHQRKEIANLSFVGGSVHPGGGIPLCLLSASIACRYID